MSDRDNTDNAAARLSAMEAELASLRDENTRLRKMLGLDDARPAEVTPWRPSLFGVRNAHDRLEDVDHESPTATKVALFRQLFVGRSDVYALRWENARTGKSGWGPAVRGGWSNSRQPEREYLPLTDEVHGSASRRSDPRSACIRCCAVTRCRLLACDFDGPGWVLDALAYLDAGSSRGDPRRAGTVAVRRRWHTSGCSSPTQVPPHRRAGSECISLREAMTVRAELDSGELRPSLPRAGLHAEGLVREPDRPAAAGRVPQARHHACSSTRRRSSPSRTSGRSCRRSTASDPSREEAMASRLRRTRHRARRHRPSDARRKQLRVANRRRRSDAQAGAMLAIDRIGVPPAILAALKHLASLHNPEFYEKEKLRFSTWNTPRFIRCYRETLDQLLLPRGLRDKADNDRRRSGQPLGRHRRATPNVEPIDVTLRPVLTAEQDRGRPTR